MADMPDTEYPDPAPIIILPDPVELDPELDPDDMGVDPVRHPDSEGNT